MKRVIFGYILTIDSGILVFGADIIRFEQSQDSSGRLENFNLFWIN